MTKHLSTAEQVALTLGKSIIAGLAGTAAMTLAQMIEMKLTERAPSTVPADAVEKVLDIKPVNEGKKEKMANEVHWTYGTAWGIPRGIIGLLGLSGASASLAHFAAVWTTAIIIEPALQLSPPITEWEPEEIGKDVFYHLLYAAVAGLVYDAMD